MINGTSSNVKNRERMTYSKSGGGGGGRHSSGGYSGRGGDHHGGSNHHHGGGGGGHQQQHHQQHMQAPNSSHHAMAAFMNQSAMAALMHQNSYAALAQAQAHANHRSGGGGGHQSSLNYYGFPPFPSASDPSIRPYSFHHHQSPQSNAQSQTGHAPYQNSRMPSNNSNNNSNTSSSSPPVTGGSSSGNGPNSSAVPAPTNGSTSVSGASGVVANSTTTTTTTSISATGGGGSNERANGSAVTTNGNGSTTPEGGKSSSLLSDHTDRSDHHYRGGSISKTNLYIRGLTPNTTDKDLHSLCSPYGNIISTKAILDKETNKCRGYGFVDFEHPLSAENAVKSLISQGVQAQMAKCSETSRHKFSLSKGSFNEHDPTNLYIANLPMSMTESDLEAMLSMYGSVISTRILKDSNGTPRGVGFARMESKEKCDAIINLLNGKMLPGSKDTLLVKFADGGSKKKHYKNNNGDRYRNDVDLQMNFDSTNMATNGVPTQLLPSPLGAASAYQRAAAFSATSPYQNALQAANPWLHQGPPQYIMQQMIPSNMDPSAALQYSPLMHQITAQMSHLQLGGVSGAGYMPGTAHAYGTQALYPQQLIQSMTLPGEESINPSHSVSSGSASGEEQQQQQQQQQQHTFQQMGYNQLQK